MATVKETVKASLVGTSEEPQLSQQIKSHFLQYARKDENTGELCMTEEEFINAIAPKNQDYVGIPVNFKKTE
jgi:solute carrier family 25 aspartate/glutamate transporter 12/13